MRTHDCEPTLNDSQVLEFCKQGFLLLPDVVSEEVNRRSIEYVEARPGIEPSEILHEDWFVDGVILNPAAAGADLLDRPQTGRPPKPGSIPGLKYS